MWCIWLETTAVMTWELILSRLPPHESSALRLMLGRRQAHSLVRLRQIHYDKVSGKIQTSRTKETYLMIVYVCVILPPAFKILSFTWSMTEDGVAGLSNQMMADFFWSTAEPNWKRPKAAINHRHLILSWRVVLAAIVDGEWMLELDVVLVDVRNGSPLRVDYRHKWQQAAGPLVQWLQSRTSR